ncbi:hypothetical protein G9A89_022807 [Geosiphon pyriformis]|nr:hypothetical protein G9A89_022807 [Geosiphon pyriformis]
MFNGAVLDEKCLITTMYMEAIVNNTPIKLILDMLVENDWLTKANATLDWTTQELLISYNGHHTKIPATCGHFQKPSTNQRPIFKFEKNPVLPAIKTYQLLWADDQRTRLLAILTWRSEKKSEWNQVSPRRSCQ